MAGERGDATGLLERIESRLYAAWMLHAIIAFSYWIPVAQGFEALISTSWYQGLTDAGQTAVSAAYWLGLGMAGFYAGLRYWRRYLQRLRHMAPRCSRLPTVSWPLGAAAGYLAASATAGGSLAVAVWLLTFVAVGTAGVALAEYEAFRRLPASLPAVAASVGGLLFLPLVPPEPYHAAVYALSVTTLGYGLAVLSYAARALSMGGG